MTIVMNMSGYEIEREALEIGYGEEIMDAGWNPEVDPVSEELQLAQTIGHESITGAIPGDLATVSAELFLRKMYSYQR